MKCFILFVLCLASLFSNVYSLGLNITTLDGYTAVVHWNREAFDPDPLTFDLRFVIAPYYDVGLAEASLSPRSTESSGNITVKFPQDGKYMLVAVAGPNSFQIGRTAATEVPGSTTVPTPSQTPTPSPTPTTSPTPTPPSTVSPSPSKSLPAMGSVCLQQKPNVPAIVGGVIGGISLTAAIIFAIFYVCRRHSKQDNRISFHGERMVQQLSPDGQDPSVWRQGGVIIPYPFTVPGSGLGSTRQSSRETDIEQGLAVPPPAMTSIPPKAPESRPSTPLPSGHVVPPPRGPRDRSKSVRRTESTRTSRPDSEPTARQRRLADKLGEIEKQIENIKSEPKPSPSTVVLLDDLEMQKAWLVKQRDSMWALEEVDSLPPGYSRYMA